MSVLYCFEGSRRPGSSAVSIADLPDRERGWQQQVCSALHRGRKVKGAMLHGEVQIEAVTDDLIGCVSCQAMLGPSDVLPAAGFHKRSFYSVVFVLMAPVKPESEQN